MNFQVIFIVLASLLLIFVSRRSLGRLHYHGFYRFFAWELIVIHFAVNIPFWFVQPLSGSQLISWFLLSLSLYVVARGFYLLHRAGGSRSESRDNLNYKFENTTRLVTEGIYTYIRHPLYCSLLLLSWGIFFKAPSLPGALLSASTSLCLYLTAKSEERENIRTFGFLYRTYMQNSKMFIPYLF